MIPIVQLKNDMGFYKSLGSLIEVLKLIAAAQYQALERKIKGYTTYLDSIGDIFAGLDLQNINHPFLKKNEKPKAIVAITTDAGLLGGLNSLVMNKALEQFRGEDSKLIIVGKRGRLYVEKNKMGYADFPGINNEQRLEQALKLRDYIVSNVLKGNIGELVVVFPRALSFAVQRIEVLNLLPFIPEERQRTGPRMDISEVILESSLGDISEYLVYLWLGQKLFEIFGLAQVAEQSARFMHLENCTQRIQDENKKLKFQYFRTRHEIIDQNMRELFSARLINE
ncbi:MAG: F0F1 ATP synthase subunit gamma [Candidatus Omnitrophica bacterium]|nr:F0F1 ATP synthase subunit gamma [Candidatus Omnitrophota bacterium]